ncbi:MAG: hypothetical protein E6H62_01385 [Betaproteobacteria bacterium]|nr:MAG: hypothetical protein E6H62_01385 [Betaproteobacteria bacterium]
MEVHACEAERGRNQGARLPAVRTQGLAVLVELGVEAPGAPAVQHRLYRGHIDSQQVGDRGEVGSERNDESDVQVAVGPAVEAPADPGREGVVDGRVAKRALNAHRFDVARSVENTGHAHHGIELEERERRRRIVEIDPARPDLRLQLPRQCVRIHFEAD